MILYKKWETQNCLLPITATIETYLSFELNSLNFHRLIHCKNMYTYYVHFICNLSGMFSKDEGKSYYIKVVFFQLQVYKKILRDNDSKE